MKWQVGDWVVCSDTDTLQKADVRRKIERRAMEALIVFAERVGQVVKKDELIAEVWGRVAVSDHSVAMVVSQLRRVLNDDAKSPRYIETITKRGYRMIAVCEKLSAEHVPPTQSTPSGALADVAAPRPNAFVSGILSWWGSTRGSDGARAKRKS